jgi:hypothetical protein
LFFEREEQLKEKKQLLISKLDHITYLENILFEIKQQNEILSASVEDEKELTLSLREKLDSEQAKIKYLEQKLNTNKQIMKNFYKELSAHVGIETKSHLLLNLSLCMQTGKKQNGMSLCFNEEKYFILICCY